jgi:hypothetical protein
MPTPRLSRAPSPSERRADASRIHFRLFERPLMAEAEAESKKGLFTVRLKRVPQLIPRNCTVHQRATHCQVSPDVCVWPPAACREGRHPTRISHSGAPKAVIHRAR